MQLRRARDLRLLELGRRLVDLLGLHRDADGHVLEFGWMDPTAASAEVAAAEQA